MAYVTGIVNDEPVTFPYLVIWKNAFDETVIGFATAATGNVRYLILDVNSDIGLTTPLYELNVNTGALSQSENVVYTDSSTPSDYYNNLKSGNYTLVQRSSKGGDLRESGIDND